MVFPFTPQTSKPELRRQLLQHRQSMPRDCWQNRSDRICQHLADSDWFQQAQLVLAYLSVRQEPSLQCLLEQNHSQCQWGIPRCVGRSLVWHLWNPGDMNALQLGPYGILEPRPELPLVASDQPDLMLLPAIACDWRGFRLGYGGGFYDRLLADPGWSTKPTVGIVFDAARLQHLPTDPWDQRLGAVCTESGLFLTPSA